MSFETIGRGGPEYLVSSLLAPASHCFSTRLGGVSTGSLASLNLGIHRGDRPGNVWENYRILGKALGFDPRETVFTRQTHTDLVARVGRENRGEGLIYPVIRERDGLVTDEPGVVLTIFTADCTPILFYDPVRRAVGGAHAGWRGTAAGIAARTVEAMTREFGCDPWNIRAAIGPCIGRCCFETDRDVPDAMRKALGGEAEEAITGAGPKYHVDLKKLNELWLRRAGVEQIDVCPDCTACQPDRFWSHRVTRGDRGSLAALIQLPREGSVWQREESWP